MMRNQLFSFLISRVLGPGTVPVGVVHCIGKPVSPEVSRIIRAKSLIDRSRGSPPLNPAPIDQIQKVIVSHQENAGESTRRAKSPPLTRAGTTSSRV